MGSKSVGAVSGIRGGVSAPAKKWKRLPVVSATGTMPFCPHSVATWSILPVVIRSSQRLSHARLSINILL